MVVAGDIPHEDANLAVVDLASVTTPLPLHPHGVRAALGEATGIEGKPRHHFVYTGADCSRLYWIDVSPQISTNRFPRVQSVFCLCAAHLLFERRFSRHSRLHS